MKKRETTRLRRWLSAFLAAAMVVTMAPVSAFAESEVPSNGAITATWEQDPATVKGGEVLELFPTDEGKTPQYIHMVGTKNHGNNPGTTPMIVVNKDATFSPEKGYFETTLFPMGTDYCFGIFLGYQDQAHPGMMIGYDDNSNWFWQNYGDSENFVSGSYGGLGVTRPATGSYTKVRIDWASNQVTKVTITTMDGPNGTVLDEKAIDLSTNDKLKFGAKMGTKYAFKIGTSVEKTVTNMYARDIHYDGVDTIKAWDVSGTVKDQNGKPLSNINVTVGGVTKAVTDANGKYTVADLLDGKHTLTFANDDYNAKTLDVTINGASITGQDVTLEPLAIPTETLSTSAMDAIIDKTFPRVIKYDMKGSLAGKTMYGQTSQLTTIKINDVNIVPTVTFKKESDAKAVYEMAVKDTANNIDAVLTAEITVKDNTLSFDITKVVNNLDTTAYPVQKIEIPNHSLVSVRSTQDDAALAGNRTSTNTRVKGDTYVDVNDSLTASTNTYMYAFVSNSELSAGMDSNSELGNAGAGSDNYRVTAVSEDKGAYKTMGLQSSFWYYRRKTTSKVGPKQELRTYVTDPVAMPHVAVAITGDANKSGKVDWQDGAVALRSVMHNPFNYEEVPDMVAYRIAMNFSGQAPNPFLTTLDNVKKVALHTDGLGQCILLKGYGSEGHDSGHPDYADIGTRIGGAEDMNYMMVEGDKLGAKFGIHVNASEMYPEAKAFNEELVRWNGVDQLAYGWNWLDQGIGINGMYDLCEGLVRDRFNALKEKVGDNLNFIYLDVWGNYTSGQEDAWETRQVSDVFTDNGWRVAHEWGNANEYDSTWSHWATDQSYGGYGSKGHNSTILRFLRNHQKDTWYGDMTDYGGSANAPLLGGYDMQDFEGWQNGNDYNNYINFLFAHNVDYKFVQHYKVMQFEEGAQVTLPTGEKFRPDMKAVLQDDDGDEVVITRKSGEYNTDVDSDYRDRTITLNGKVVLTGGATPGNSPSTKGDLTYLLPWIWNSATNEKVPQNEEKLYHWNTRGGTTTWELPAGWANLENVMFYELTGSGKINEQSIKVADGKITLTADAEIPYVLTKGTETNLDIDWSTNMHLVDVGFNSGNLDNWDITGAGEASIAENAAHHTMLKMDGEVSMTQTMTDLKPGEKYAVYLGIDNLSDAKAWMIVESGDKVLGSNYTERSYAKNYVSSYAHNTNQSTESGTGSRFQNMYVFFTAPASGEVTLTLKREAGEGSTYIDDIRVLENGAENIKAVDEEGNVTRFEQDFENNAQGIYPFVVGPIEGVSDNRTHLSEKHAPYTQAGWNIKGMDDVLEGTWSLKTNGLSSCTQWNSAGQKVTSITDDLVYQTIPQNFRFMPGVTYKITFDYQAGWDGNYAFAVGTGEYTGKDNLQITPLSKAYGTTGKAEFQIVGDPTGQTWIGIYSTNTVVLGAETDETGKSNNIANFNGMKDFVLDNLVIEVGDVSKGDLDAAIREANTKFEQDYSAETWTPFAEALKTANEVMNKMDATQEEVDAATKALTDATEALHAYYGTVSGVVTGVDNKPVAGAEITLSCDNLANQIAVTDENGRYEFTDIFIRDYNVKVIATGYETIFTESVTPEDRKTVTKDIALTMKEIAEYSNTFDDGDVSMFVKLPEGNTNVDAASNVDSALVTFNSNSVRNSIALGDAPQFANGMIEFDVTPLGTPGRFGIVFRASADNADRIYVGLNDNPTYYFRESFGRDGHNDYSGANQIGPAFAAGVTRHMKAEIIDNTVSMWVDGQHVGDFPLSDGAPKAAGYVGFNHRSSGQFILDNIEVTSYDPAPAGTQNVIGSVVDTNEAPIYNAKITLTDANGDMVAQTSTNLKGEYKVHKVPAGTYTMTVSATGYKTVTKEVTVADAELNAGVTKLGVDTESLQALYDQYAGHEADYLPSSWSAMEAALELAKTVLDSETPSVAQIQEATNAILEAAKVLKDKFFELDAALEQAEGITDKGYTKDSWTAFENAVNDAKALRNSDTATAEQIAAAVKAINDAIAGLTMDRSALDAAIAKAESLNESSYTAESWAVLKAALEAGKALGADATAEQIKAAADAINSAISNLVLVEGPADRTKLDALIAKAEALTETDYTPESWAALQEALSGAKALGDDATAEQIANACKALEDAMANLKKAGTVLRDEKTGVTVSAEPGVIPVGAQLVVKAIGQDDEALKLAQQALAGMDGRFAMWDITLVKDGVEVQPDGTVVVTIPLPEGYAADRLELYLIKEDGTKEKVNFRISNNTVIFETTHFSLYALYERKADDGNGGSSSSGGNGGDSSSSGGGSNGGGGTTPSTGDTPITSAAILLLASGAVAMFLRKRKKDEIA